MTQHEQTPQGELIYDELLGETPASYRGEPLVRIFVADDGLVRAEFSKRIKKVYIRKSGLIQGMVESNFWVGANSDMMAEVVRPDGSRQPYPMSVMLLAAADRQKFPIIDQAEPGIAASAGESW